MRNPGLTGAVGMDCRDVSSRVFALVISRALAGREVRFEVIVEELGRAFNGRIAYCNEIAQSLSFVESEDSAEVLEAGLAALPLLPFLQQWCERLGFHSASRTLAAVFDGEKFGDF